MKIGPIFCLFLPPPNGIRFVPIPGLHSNSLCGIYFASRQWRRKEWWRRILILSCLISYSAGAETSFICRRTHYGILRFRYAICLTVNTAWGSERSYDRCDREDRRNWSMEARNRSHFNLFQQIGKKRSSTAYVYNAWVSKCLHRFCKYNHCSDAFHFSSVVGPHPLTLCGSLSQSCSHLCICYSSDRNALWEFQGENL